MSRARVWAVVEGSNHDIPFYEGILADGAGVSEIELIQASDVAVNGVAAGGKSHLLKIFRVFDAEAALEQENSRTKVDVLFFADRDDDEYIGAIVDHPHVQYTHCSDIEAEILDHSRLDQAVARAFSLSRSEALQHSPKNPAEQLASVWSEWISLRLASAKCGWSDTRFAQPSGINSPRYGEVEQARVEQICQRVRDAHPNWDETLERARAHVAVVVARGEGARLVKGKWLPSFVVYLMKLSIGSDRSLPTVNAAHLITACLMTIDFEKVWAARYASRLAPILAR